MSDGGPDVTGPQWQRDTTRPCPICTKPGCYPIDHTDELLSDEDARRWAQIIIDDGSNTRATMLARYIISKAKGSADPQPQDDESHVIQLSGNAPLEIFPFVTLFHREVVLRHKDDESQDIEMTPDEADEVAELLWTAAAQARTR